MALEQYIEDIELLNEKGFFPIFITTMMCETTFCFKSNTKALEAFEQLEQKGILQGWWYGINEFYDVIDWYQYLNKQELIYYKIDYIGKEKKIMLTEISKEYLL